MTSVEVTYSERGFPQFDDAVDTDYGHAVRIYGSSSAEKDAVWMSVKKGEPKYGGELPACDVSVHMDLEQATAIRNRLSAWINMINGYNDTEVVELRREIHMLKAERRALAIGVYNVIEAVLPERDY